VVESDGLLNRCRLNPYPGFESRTLRMGLLLCGVFVLLGPVRAQQSVSPTSQYLAQRRASPIVWGLTLDKVRENPGAYRGKAFEIEGTVSGTATSTSSDSSALLLLNTNSTDSLTLRMSIVPTWLQPGAVVRALCIVTDTEENANVIGTPELEVLAVASALDIGALEARWKAEQAETAARKKLELERQKEQERQRLIASSASRGNLASRGVPAKSTSTKRQIIIGPARYEDLSGGARAVFPVYRDFIRNHNKRLGEVETDKITYAVLCYSELMDMDPRLIVATVIAESDFKVQDRSRAGAMGLIQLMPDEVARLKLTNPYDPIQNIAAGIFLLKERLNKYSGSSRFTDATDQQIILTLASYNAGEGAVKKYGGVPPYKETQGYVKKIMRLYKELCGIR
jgi:soluble lytic murein transglycosylase-like protein